MASASENASEEPPPPDVLDAMHTHPISLHDYHCFQHDLQATAHALETPHLPLPLDTPLPPASYEFPTHGTFSGPAAHPLFEGVVAMHHMLGHDLSVDWSDMSACDQSNTMHYPHYSAAAYTYQPASQWSSPPTSIVESIPSPLEESPPGTPERIPEYAFDPVLVQDAPAVQPRSNPQPAPAERHSAYPLVVTSATSYELPVAFQADVSTTQAYTRAAIHTNIRIACVSATKDREGVRQVRSACCRLHTGETRRAEVVYFLFSSGRATGDGAEAKAKTRRQSLAGTKWALCRLFSYRQDRGRNRYRFPRQGRGREERAEDLRSVRPILRSLGVVSPIHIHTISLSDYRNLDITQDHSLQNYCD